MIILLTFASDDDREKFEYLYNNYKNLLLHKAHGILHDYMLAEDAVSEAYLRVYRNLHKVEDPSSNSSISFLVTICKNVALTMLQKTKQTAADNLDDVPDQSDGFELEGYILSELSSETIYTVLGQVSEELRSVFVLKFAYDYSHREIGELLGITENNVTVRLHRAKKKLSELLVREGYVHEYK